MRRPGGGWTTSAVGGCAGESDCPAPEGEDYGTWTSLAVVGGLPRIAFYDEVRGDLKLAEQQDGGAWRVVTEQGEMEFGAPAHIAMGIRA